LYLRFCFLVAAGIYETEPDRKHIERKNHF
jgi:hypothetical protein